MIIRKAPPRQLALDEPIRHAAGHKRPVTRRDFLAQGFAAGLGTVVAPTVFGLFANPRAAMFRLVGRVIPAHIAITAAPSAAS